MMYREPENRSRAVLEADLSAASPATVARALIDLAHFREPVWAVDRLLVALDDGRAEVVNAGLTGLAVLARRGGMPTDRRVWRKVLEHSDSEEFGGQAEDVLDDFEVYGNVGSRDQL